ncbi:amidohydrolase family protein [uncultured Modestobacter sp.]|uniref:amidohydrolase family protein n=1 Tax=uncultured Modestobacter sp. TaxID=380048 RepID=UPI0026042031|nr:amidohydrolase family protein [uncultured Modestobacter sp.]
MPGADPADLLLRRVRVADRLVDVLVRDGLVAAVADRLAPARGVREVDGGGGALIPGLHDHHLHLRALAAVQASVQVGPAQAPGPDAFGAVLRGAPGDPTSWIRAIGHHESTTGPLDRWRLDALVPDRPVRVQHRSGVLWTLNSAGLRELGPLKHPGVERNATGEPTGRLWRADGWLAARTRRDGDGGQLAATSRRLAATGVTGLTEATPGAGQAEVDDLRRATADGVVLQRVHRMAEPGTSVPPGELVTVGPVKVLLDDDRLPALDDLVDRCAAAHAAGVPVAVHCVTQVQLVLTLTALRMAGPRHGDRIEHGALVPASCLADLRELGLTVVTQPNLVAERGEEYLQDVPAPELPDLWRCASLHAAGVRLAIGTDAPFGDADPWAALTAATRRRTPSGQVLGPAERLPARVALRLLTGAADDPARPRRIGPGAPADLCLLDGALDDVLSAPSAERVRATVVAGRVVAER